MQQWILITKKVYTIYMDLDNKIYFWQCFLQNGKEILITENKTESPFPILNLN